MQVIVSLIYSFFEVVDHESIQAQVTNKIDDGPYRKLNSSKSAQTESRVLYQVQATSPVGQAAHIFPSHRYSSVRV